MKKVHFILGLHNHQPVGNFSEVFQRASEKAYLPWIRMMAAHPEIKWNLHASGILWDWMSEHETSYIQTVDELVKKGSLEILTGGYYEPILPVLPDVDKIGQIRKMTRYIQEEFSYSPQGLWLAERVWEPHLPAVLHKAGVAYTVLDDRHFFEAGMHGDALNGYFVTEEQGSTLNVFPINHTLRYMVPFAPPEDTIAFLKERAVEGGDSVVVLADDGEKFGLWPGTYDLVYKNGWLERFIQLLNENSDWLIMSTFSEILKKFTARSQLFIPSASYFEMSEWSLPVTAGTAFEKVQKDLKESPLSADIQRFMKGGFWRNFFIRYPESNDMHKKMLHVSKKVNSFLGDEKNISRRHRLIDAQEHLWAGQCNCAYWHGVFGGIYLPHLRNAVFEHLVTAEALLKNEKQGYSYDVSDYRKTGRQELLISGDDQNLYFSPDEGGTLFEWDVIKHKLNLANVLTRRKEVYHQKVLNRTQSGNNGHGSGAQSIHDLSLCKEEGLEKLLNYDWYRRVSFVDHFFHAATSKDMFAACSYGEQGDFINARYKWKIGRFENGLSLALMREGRVWVDRVHCPVFVKKKIILKEYAGFELYYSVKNVGEKPVSLWFGYEMNFMFSEKDSQDNVNAASVSSWERDDKWFGFSLAAAFGRSCDLWTFPIETVSSAEDGFEKTYQGTSVVPNWKIELAPGETADFPCCITVKEKKQVHN